MVIEIRKITQTCLSADDGIPVFHEIRRALDEGDDVQVSFSGISGVTSSFVNSALITLLDRFPFAEIQKRVTFTHSNRQVNDVIRKRFNFEINHRKAEPAR